MVNHDQSTPAQVDNLTPSDQKHHYQTPEAPTGPKKQQVCLPRPSSSLSSSRNWVTSRRLSPPNPTEGPLMQKLLMQKSLIQKLPYPPEYKATC